MDDGSIRSLLIEDNALQARLVLSALDKDGGFTTSHVITLGEAVTSCESGEFDVVLADLFVPDSEGLATIEALLALEPALPIVALTGESDGAVGMEALKCGAQDFVVKTPQAVAALPRVLRYAYERHRILRELQDAEKTLRSVLVETRRIIDAVPSILIGLKDSVVSRWNETATELLEVAPADAMGRRLEELGIGWDAAAIESAIASLEVGATRRLDDISVSGPGGRDLILAVSLKRIDHGGAGGKILILGDDVTERRQLEGQLMHTQKLEAIGQLAAGIAHEINTPTQYVRDNLSFLSESFGELCSLLEVHQTLLADETAVNEAARERAKEKEAEVDLPYLLDEIPQAFSQALEGVQRVAKIVSAMKEFSHPGAEDLTPVDLNRAIESTITVARNEWKYVADVELDLAEDLPAVTCLVGEINQVVLNLVVNAAHAIEAHEEPGGKGKITISTRSRGDMVEISIADTGTGIPEGNRARIFDPFFTTKEVGRGTGQGLSIAHGVITQQHGGSIDFETELGQGTTFRILLPFEQVRSNEEVPV